MQVDRTFSMKKLWAMVLKILSLLWFTPSVILLTDLNHWKQYKWNKSGIWESGPFSSIQQKKEGFFRICHPRNTQRHKPALNMQNTMWLTENKPSTPERPWHVVTRKFTPIAFGFTSKRAWLLRSPEQFFVPCVFPCAVDASLQLVKRIFPFSWLSRLVGMRHILREVPCRTQVPSTQK